MLLKYFTVFGTVTSVDYVVDGGESQNITVNDADSLTQPNPPRTLSFSTTLNLTGGVHSVYVGVEANSYYFNNPLSNQGYSVLVHGGF